MTNEEKDLLIAYLADAGEIDPDGDVEAQFLDWYQVREGVVPGETHYKAILDAEYAGGALGEILLPLDISCSFPTATDVQSSGAGLPLSWLSSFPGPPQDRTGRLLSAPS